MFAPCNMLAVTVFFNILLLVIQIGNKSLPLPVSIKCCEKDQSCYMYVTKIQSQCLNFYCIHFLHIRNVWVIDELFDSDIITMFMNYEKIFTRNQNRRLNVLSVSISTSGDYWTHLDHYEKCQLLTFGMYKISIFPTQNLPW